MYARFVQCKSKTALHAENQTCMNIMKNNGKNIANGLKNR